jgi:SAM-dependent methyltransferase
MTATAVLRQCYEALFGRAAVRQGATNGAMGARAADQDLMTARDFSPEYQETYRAQILKAYFESAEPDIQVAVKSSELKVLFDRIRAQWTVLGESEPYWSVLTQDKYLNAHIDDRALADFYLSGERDADLIEKAARRCGVSVRKGVCLELGCGVGRITKHLARRFGRVIAVDVSQGNLWRAKQMAASEGLKNVEFVLIDSLAKFKFDKNIDFFFSIISIQHNPPPLQYHIIDQAIRSLMSGGSFLFQTQTFCEGYQFSVKGYLDHPPDKMDMHSLPMPEILTLLARNGCLVKEVMEDFWTGRFGSHTFFGVRE